MYLWRTARDAREDLETALTQMQAAVNAPWRGTLGKARSCRAKNVAYFTAKGKTRWTFKVKGPLPSGKYWAPPR